MSTHGEKGPRGTTPRGSRSKPSTSGSHHGKHEFAADVEGSPDAPDELRRPGPGERTLAEKDLNGQVILAADEGSDDVAITLRDVQVEASWGHIYGPVNMTVRKGGVTVVVGQGGRGRTALLLTLAGRMKPSSGSVVSFGDTDDPHALFRRAGIGFVSEIDEIVQAIRVRDIVTEQLRWGARWFTWVAPATEEDLIQLCRPVFGDLDLPDLDAMVEELPELTAALFRIAAANARKPEVLVVGGIDNLTSVEASATLLGRLVELGREQTVITADVNGRRTELDVRDYVEVPNLTNQEFASVKPQKSEARR